MRLSEEERTAILGAVACLDSSAEVYLFGSRVDDSAKGGDIDILVLSGTIDFGGKLDILVDLHKRLGDRKVDLVIEPDLKKPFTRIAVSRGVRL